MKAIYETKGRAREYCELAINLYTGCSHNCIYCYGAAVTHQDKERWGQNPQPRKGIIVQIQRDAERYSKLNEKRPILMCFVTDPYQPVDDTHRLARKAILILKAYDLRVVILTKAGIRAQRDWDLLDKRDAFCFALTRCLVLCLSELPILLPSPTFTNHLHQPYLVGCPHLHQLFFC